MTQGQVRLGVSACLVGEKTRYDGTDKRDAFLVDTLGPHVELVPVCPETECGLGVPREPMHLVGDPASPRLVTIDTSVDLTSRMNQWIARRAKELHSFGLHGLILKARSPSCGIRHVPVHPENGARGILVGVGLFARAIMNQLPDMPLIDEDGLHDPEIRADFIERAFARAGQPPPPACQ